MLFARHIVCLVLLLLAEMVSAQQTKPTIAVLGVTHSVQLISILQQPAALRAFIKRVKPNAICIERSPEEFARNDFYEFTYEQQYVVVPFAKRQGIPLYTIDWIPRGDDVMLAFGVADLEVPGFVRKGNGFWGFTYFTDPRIGKQTLHYAEDSSTITQTTNWYSTYPSKKVNTDFARRLFLYRTFLQAKRIQAAAQNYSSQDTVLVIIGSYHKDDIEKHLTAAGYPVMKTSLKGEPQAEEVENNRELTDAYAIASFNLLGLQSTQTVNLDLVSDAIKQISTIESWESELLRLKYKLLMKQISSKEAIKQYVFISSNVLKTEQFTWNGVKHINRIDSYFDPFGNMTVWQRVQLELAKEYLSSDNKKGLATQKLLLDNELTGLKKAMFNAYWTEYIIQKAVTNK